MTFLKSFRYPHPPSLHLDISYQIKHYMVADLKVLENACKCNKLLEKQLQDY